MPVCVCASLFVYSLQYTVPLLHYFLPLNSTNRTPHLYGLIKIKSVINMNVSIPQGTGKLRVLYEGFPMAMIMEHGTYVPCLPFVRTTYIDVIFNVYSE